MTSFCNVSQGDPPQLASSSPSAESYGLLLHYRVADTLIVENRDQGPRRGRRKEKGERRGGGARELHGMESSGAQRSERKLHRVVLTGMEEVGITLNELRATRWEKEWEEVGGSASDSEERPLFCEEAIMRCPPPLL